MGRRRVALTGAVLGALLFPLGASASAGPPPPGTLTVVIPGPFTGCDPGSPTTSKATDAVLSLVLPSAFTARQDGSPNSDLEVISQAEPVSPDPLTVVFTIARGATWPDGTPFTAEDLRRTWLERRDVGSVADLGYRDVTYVRPSHNAMTATVGFATPYADWPSLFDGIVPAATATARCTSPSAALDPSLGPYQIVSATTTRIRLRANPAWTGAPPGFPDVVITDRIPRRPAFVAARVLYLPAPTLATLEAVTSPGDLASRLDPSSSVVSLDFALHGTDALPLAARRGVAGLIDRTAVVDAVAAPVDDAAAPEDSHLFGQGDPDYSGAFGSPVSRPMTPLPPLPGATGAAAYGAGPDLAVADADLRAAGLEKSAAGWLRDGSPAGLCLAVPERASTLRVVAGVLAGQLATQGLHIEIDRLASETAVAGALRAGSCAAGLLARTGDWYVSHTAASWVAPSPPVPPGVLWEGLDDPVVQADAQAAMATLNPIDAASTWDLLDDRLWSLMVGLPLYSPSAYVGWSTSVAGVLQCDSVIAFVDQVPTLLPSSGHE